MTFFSDTGLVTGLHYPAQGCTAALIVESPLAHCDLLPDAPRTYLLRFHGSLPPGFPQRLAQLEGLTVYFHGHGRFCEPRAGRNAIEVGVLAWGVTPEHWSISLELRAAPKTGQEPAASP